MLRVGLHRRQPPDERAHKGQLLLEGHGGEGRDVQEDAGLCVCARVVGEWVQSVRSEFTT